MSKTYSELILLPTFQERFDYCKLGGIVGDETFGSNRYLNQRFYHSYEWKNIIRPFIIRRDNANDLALEDYPINGSIYVHHLNPIAIEDLLNRRAFAYLPEYMVSCSLHTHNALHYGSLPAAREYIARRPNDTAPWLMEED